MAFGVMNGKFMAFGVMNGGALRLRLQTPSFSPLLITMPMHAYVSSRLCLRPSFAVECCHSGSASSDQSPPQEAVLKAISEVSKTEGRVAQTTNVVMGGTITGESADEWKVLDQKVNSYPTVRGFTAIGTGGDDFVQAMVGAVESVLQYPIPESDTQTFIQRKVCVSKHWTCEGCFK